MAISFVGDFVPVSSVPPSEALLQSIVVGNLECAFADGEVRCGKAYASILPWSCMKYIGEGGFSALSLANNHVNDAANLREVCAELRSRFRGVQFFGTIDNPYAAFIIEDSRVIIIGCLEPCRSRGRMIFRQEDVLPLIRELRSVSGSKRKTNIFVYPHWGKEGEYTRYPSPQQRRLAREWIDAGANGIIGNHAHVPQGMERYKGCPIYYSLGNYAFEGGIEPDIPESSERMIVRWEEGRFSESFEPSSAQSGFLAACEIFSDQWTLWRWARVVGPLYFARNMVSWRLRFKKSWLSTFPKFVAWNLLPRNLLFHLVKLIGGER